MKRLLPLTVCALAGLAVALTGGSSTARAIIIAGSPGLNIHITSQTSRLVTVAWTPLPGEGYVFKVGVPDGAQNRVSLTGNAGLNQTRFSIVPGVHVYSVVELIDGESGTVTVPTVVTTTTVTTTTPTVPTTTTQPTTTTTPTGSSCFASPGSCGYPDPKTGNVGVPANVSLTNSGSITVSTPGTTITGLNVTGTISVRAANVTITNTRVNSGSANCGICMNDGVRAATNLHISHSTLISSNGESNLWNHYYDTGLTVDTTDMEGSTDPIEGEAPSLTNSYLLASGTTPQAHYEDVYLSDGTLVANHDTLLNPHMQTAEVFGDTQLGGGGPADNHITITNSLLAGGGYMIYAISASSSVGSSTTNIQNNRFARCKTSPVYNPDSGGSTCSAGPDGFGYWPYGGYFGVATSTPCPPTQGQQWANNVWDDNGATIAC